MRTHGAARRRPLAAFQDEDRHTLVPWDGAPYDTGNWPTARAHRGHHGQCGQALSSAPSTLYPAGQEVQVRPGTSWCAPSTSASRSGPTSVSPGEAAPPAPRAPPPADDLFKGMAQGRVGISLDHTFRSFLAPGLPIQDDLGRHRLNAQQSADLCEPILNRHRVSSLVITGNRRWTIG